MPTPQYLETVFETLESALEHGIIDEWTVKGAKFVIHDEGERITVSQRKIADYVSALLRRHVERAEAVKGASAEATRAAAEPTQPTAEPMQVSREISQRPVETGHWLRFAIS